MMSIIRKFAAIFFALCAVMGLAKSTDLSAEKYIFEKDPLGDHYSLYINVDERVKADDSFECHAIGTCLTAEDHSYGNTDMGKFYFFPKHAGKATVAIVYAPDTLSDDTTRIYIVKLSVDKDLNVTITNVREVIR